MARMGDDPVTRRRERWWGSDDGQALVEFAIVVPVLLLLIVGLAEFARAWNTRQILTDAAREALRSSVVANPEFTYDALLALIDQSLVRAALDPDNADVSVEGWKTGTGTRARLRIDYRYEFGFLGPFIGWATDDRSLALSTSFVMRNE
jgi:Flp pilus assembly protein TadG